MQTAPASPQPQFMARLLAGLEAGIAGGALVMAWFAFNAILHGQRWYATPNLLGSTFYGDFAFVAGAGRVTAAGLSLHLIVTGCAGALFGALVPLGLGAWRTALAGALVAMLGYAVLFTPFWKLVNPWVPLYSSSRTMLVAHLLFGLSLGRWPAALARLACGVGR